MTQIGSLRAMPNSDFIEQIRRRFPTDVEIDKVLTKKMYARVKGEQYSPISLEQLIGYTQQFIALQIGSKFTLLNPRWLAGGASKLQMAFSLCS